MSVPAAQSASGNKQMAQQQAARLLSLTRVPPDAVETPAHPSALDQPAMGMSAASSQVDRHRFWRVSTDLDATLAWIRAHPPRGLTSFGSTSGSGPSYRMAGVGYSAPDEAGVTDLELAIGVATVPGGTAIRADGMAVWLDPQPLRDAQRGPRLRVTVTGGCPRSDAGDVGVRRPRGHDATDRLIPPARPAAALVCDYAGMNARRRWTLADSHRLVADAAHRLAQAVNRLPLAHPDNDVTPCPADDGTATVVAFSYAGQPDADLWVDRMGCATVSNGSILTAAGHLGRTLTALTKKAAG